MGTVGVETMAHMACMERTSCWRVELSCYLIAAFAASMSDSFQ